MKSWIFFVLFVMVFLFFAYSESLGAQNSGKYVFYESVRYGGCGTNESQSSFTLKDSSGKNTFYCVEERDYNAGERFVVDSYLQSKFVKCKDGYERSSVFTAYFDEESFRNGIVTDVGICLNKTYEKEENLVKEVFLSVGG